jgi:large repetitive protein
MPFTVTTEKQVNTTTTNNEFTGVIRSNVAYRGKKSVALDADGDIVVAWTGGAAGQFDVYHQRFDKQSGTTLLAQGTEQVTNTLATGNTLGNQLGASVAMDSDGDYVVVWSNKINAEIGDDPRTYGVFARRYSKAGVAEGAEVLINTFKNSDQYQPTIARIQSGAKDGEYVIAWVSDGQDIDGTSGIYFRKFAADGTQQVAETRVGALVDALEENPAIAINKNGNFVITWSTPDGTTLGGNGDDIYAQAFNSSGVAIGAAFRVNSFATDTQISPSVAIDDQDNFVIVWSSTNQEPGKIGVYGRRFKINGSTIDNLDASDRFIVRDVGLSSTGTDATPSVAVNPTSGSFVVTWSGADADRQGIYAARFAASGAVLDDVFLVNTTEPGVQNNPSVSMNSEDDFIISWTGVDDPITGSTGVFTRAYNIPPDAPPEITLSSATVTYTEDQPAVALVDAGFNITDVSTSNSGNLREVSIEIIGFVTGQDKFNLPNSLGGLTLEGTPTSNKITLKASATTGVAASTFVNVIRNITFESGQNPTTAARTIQIQAIDTASVVGAASRSLTVIPVNDNPTISMTAGNVAYDEGDDPILVDSSLVLVDVDDENLESATVTIVGYKSAQSDRLEFTAQSGITGAFDTTTGVLTFTGSAPKATYLNLLRSVKFGSNDGASNRTIRFSVSDGDGVGTADRIVAIQEINDPPVIRFSNPAVTEITFTEGTPLKVDDLILVTDEENDPLSGVRIVLGNYVPGTVADPQDAITVTIPNGSGIQQLTSVESNQFILRLTGTASLAVYQGILRSLTFNNASTNPSFTTNRTISISAEVGQDVVSTINRTIKVVNVAGPPVLTMVDAPYTVNEKTEQSIDANLSLLDSDSPIKGAVVEFVSGFLPEDSLRFNPSGSITGSFDSVTQKLILTGEASAADYQAALRSVNYFNANRLPNTTTVREIRVTVTDTSDLTATDRVTFTVLDTTDPPVITFGTDPTTYNEKSAAIAIDANLATSDEDSTDWFRAIVRIESFNAAEDLLEVIGTLPTGITADTSVVGTITLNGQATKETYQTALRQIGYRNSSNNPTGTSRTIRFSATDDAGFTRFGSSTRTIQIQSQNDLPVVTLQAGPQGYVEAGTELKLDLNLTVTDADDTQLKSVTITISEGYVAGQDSLGFNPASLPAGVTAKPGNTPDTLVFEGLATLSTYQAFLRSLFFVNSSATPVEQTRKVKVTVVDAKDGENALTETAIAVRDNKAPVLTASTTDAIAFSEGGTPILFDSGLLVTDADSANLTRAEIRVDTPGAGDSFTFDQTKLPTGVTATPGSGGLVFTGSATKESYQALLQTVQYSNSSSDPSTTFRRVELVVKDEFENSNTVQRILNVTANTAPVLAPDTGAIAYIEGQTVAIATGVTITDPDSANLQSLTVTIGGFIASEDEIVVPATLPDGIITTGFNATSGSITFTGGSTLENYRTLLQALQYRNKSNDPSDAGRTLQITVNDGIENSNVASRTIGVTKNAAPTISIRPTIEYEEGQGDVFLDQNLVLNDADPDPDLIAKVTITIQNYDAISREDVLAFTQTLVPTGVTTTGFDPATGTLTFTGSAPIEAYGDLLRSVIYKNTSSNPAASRAIAVVVNDGIEDSTPGIVDIGITSVATTPIIDTTDAALVYAEQSGPQSVDDGLTVLDADSPILKGATVEFIEGTFADGQDVLSFTPIDGISITGNWDAIAGKLTLSGDASVADYQTALRSIKFTNNSTDPNTRTRRLSFSASDETGKGLGTVREITIGIVNTPPVVTPTPGSASYTENALPAKVDDRIQVSDSDSPALVGAKVKITNVQTGDVLAFAPQAGINGSYDAATGELVLSGSGTVADYQSVLRSVTFATPSENPDPTPRQLEFTVSDSNATSLVATRTVNVVPVNDPPTIAVSSPGFSYAAGIGTVAIDTGITLADVDSANLTEATIEITNYIAGEDVLALPGTGTITGSFNPTTGKLTLSGSATLADYQAALRTVTYSNTAVNPTLTERILKLTVKDSSDVSQPATRLIQLSNTNTAPVVTTTTATPLAYNENAGAQTIDAAITVTDADSTLLTGGTVAIASYIATEESLAFATIGGITGSFNATTGVLTLSGTASVAAYQAALRNVTYANRSSNPSSLTRTIQFSVRDIGLTSTVSNRIIQITPANSAPFVAALSTPLPYAEGTGAIAIDPSLIVQDIDGDNLTQASVTLTGFVPGQDILSFAPQAGITGNFNAATGILLFTGTASVETYQTLLRSVTYVNSNGSPATTPRTAQFVVRDGSTNSNIANRPIRIVTTNDAPVITSEVTRKVFDKNIGIVSLDQELAIADSDSTDLTGATIKFTGYIPGQDNLNFLDQNGITASINGATGELTLTGTASVAAYEAALRSITYINNSDQIDSRPRQIEISVTDGSARSNTISIQIDFDENSGIPVIDVNGSGIGNDFTNTFTIVGDPVPVIASDARILGRGSLTSVQVFVANALDGSQEELLVNTEGTGLTASYGSNKSILRLTGNASSETYLQVLRTVRYINRSTQPDRTTRVIRFNAVDGDRRSETTQTTMQITQVNLRGGTPSEDRFLVTTPGTDFIDAFGSNDTVSSIVEYLQQDDTIDGGLGTDTLKLTDGSGLAIVNVADPTQLRGILRGKTVVANFEYFDFSGFNGTAQMTGSDRQDDRLMGGNGSDQIMGMAGQDLLMGNAGNDALDGGAGNDTMMGGIGDDQYTIDSPNDVIVEDAEAGFDTVISLLPSYKLLDQFEDLRLSGGAIAGTGNAVANRITGNDLDNTLDGDLGNDFLVGNGGNDTLIGNVGNDELRAGTGNDRLLGGVGNDRLYGDRGRDRLSGGKGRDSFAYSSRKDGGDRITDFNAKDDTILISRAGFNRSLKRGKISAAQFALGSSARDSSDRFIYNQGTGSLFYDADGVGGSRQVLLAQMTNKPSLTRADIVITR